MAEEVGEEEALLAMFPIPSSMRRAAITVDVDADLNRPEKGRVGAISQGTDRPRYRSCAEGLHHILLLFDELGIEGTFFVEARAAEHLSEDERFTSSLARHEVAAHGYEHEDMTGEHTGVPLTERETCLVMEKGLDTIERTFGKRPSGFRAPYLHINEHILRVISRYVSYDSSLTRRMEAGAIHPFRIGSLVEIPVAVYHGGKGRMHSYLWPLHEGRRAVDDYLEMIDSFEEGLLVLATHSWHLVETYGSGRLGAAEVRANRERTRAVLERLGENGIETIRLRDYLDRDG